MTRCLYSNVISVNIIILQLTPETYILKYGKSNSQTWEKGIEHIF
jgi:hypothetical protein